MGKGESDAAASRSDVEDAKRLLRLGGYAVEGGRGEELVIEERDPVLCLWSGDEGGRADEEFDGERVKRLGSCGRTGSDARLRL